jgi:hypothetical protein
MVTVGPQTRLDLSVMRNASEDIVKMGSEARDGGGTVGTEGSRVLAR